MATTTLVPSRTKLGALTIHKVVGVASLRVYGYGSYIVIAEKHTGAGVYFSAPVYFGTEAECEKYVVLQIAWEARNA